MPSLAELGEISKAHAEEVSKIGLPKVPKSVPGIGVARNVAGRATGGARKVRGAAGEATQNLGRKIGEKMTQPGREYADRLNQGIDEGMIGGGNLIGEAIGNQIKTKVGEAQKKLIRNSLIAGGVGTLGVAGTYDVARRREHRRRQEGMLMEASLKHRRKRAVKRA